MSWLTEYVKDQIRYQIADHSAVKINHKYHEKFNKIFIDSRAGLITFKPKNVNDMTRFRNKWVNRIEELRLKEKEGKDINKELFVLYSDIMENEKVSYEANLNTRIKKNLWCLKKSIWPTF